MPPDKRKPPAQDRRLSEGVSPGGFDTSEHLVKFSISQLRPRPIGPGELAALRAIFWRQAALGHRLPAEIGVIVLEGGRT